MIYTPLIEYKSFGNWFGKVNDPVLNEFLKVWGKIEVLIDKGSLLPIEQSYFNERGEKIRVMRFSDIKHFSGRDIPATMTMTPLNKPEQKTVVHYRQLELDVDIDEDVFTLRNLKKRVY